MKVQRIQTETGSHIDPPLQEWWGNEAQLEWKAAVASVDTGLPVSIRYGEYRRGRFKVPGIKYCVVVGYSGTSPKTFSDAWTYINGVVAGAQQAKRAAEESA